MEKVWMLNHRELLLPWLSAASHDTHSPVTRGIKVWSLVGQVV